MFYSIKDNNHNLKSNPFKACIVPRPIAWISTLNPNNSVNIGPYSYFNAISDIPPLVMFASGYDIHKIDKDTIKNIERTKEFVINIASDHSCEFLNLSSSNLPFGESESEKFNISLNSSNIIRTPRIEQSKINLECTLVKIEEIILSNAKASSKLIFGEVVGIHIDDEIIVDGKIDILKLKPLARLGYDEYSIINNIFKMKRM